VEPDPALDIAGSAADSPLRSDIEAASDADALNLPVGERGGKVGPGQRMPFFLTFYEYPPDLWSYRLKVTATTGLPGVAALP